MKNDEKTTIGKSRPSTWVKECQKMSKGLKLMWHGGSKYGGKSSPEHIRNETQLTQLTSSQKTQQIDTACLCLSQGPLEHTIDSVLLPQKKRTQKRKQQKKVSRVAFQH